MTENESNVPAPSDPNSPLVTPDSPIEAPVEATLVQPDLMAEPPRLWTTFAAFFGSIGLMIVLSVIVIAIYLAPTIADSLQDGNPTELTESLLTPLGFIVQAFPTQLAIAFTAIMAAILSPIAFRERIGFCDSGLSTVEWLATGIGAFVPAAIGMGFAYLMTLVIQPDQSVAKLYESMTVAWAVPFVLFIALAPGFAEEMLMRGYMQRRFLQRWSPSLSIFVSASLFALLHVMPHTVVFAFPIGLWFGYVAWKTDSIWPTILGHVLINGVWNILNVSYRLAGYSESTYYVLCGVLLAVGVAAFLFSWPAIHRASARKQSRLVAA